MSFRVSIAAACLSLALVSPATAQEELTSRTDVVSAMSQLETRYSDYTEWQIQISEIPAPPFEEAERAAFLASEFRRIGLEEVQIDAAGNVTGLRPGVSDSILVLSAHLDTVFPPGTDVTVKREGSRLVGPGIADDAAGLMALMALASEIGRAGIETHRSLLFVGTVGEEGLGDLRGVKHLVREGPYRDRIAAFVSIDGTSPTRIVHQALGSRRYRVTITGPGGHSWGAFGRVNPAHALGGIIARFTAMPVPEDPKTTYNIGRIGGGTSVNSIPFEAWMEVDMRSTSQSSLERIEQLFLGAVQQSVEAENLFRSASGTKLTVDPALIGDRPGGETSTDQAVYQAAAWATRAMGLEPDPAQSSTDSNIPISMGIPAVTIGAGGSSENAHSLAEWFDPTGGHIGLQRALLMILAYDQMAAQ
ncbi:MAG: tripeptide aminopeptidase [Rhodothermales bacterium]|jgi:tripeptide aminopeptidase